MAYIKLEDLQKFPIRIDHYDKEHSDEAFILGIESVIDYAESLPAADVAEVKHSTWNEYYSFEKWHYDCPLCDFGFAVGIKQEEPPNYCEHCGVKMDKKG